MKDDALGRGSTMRGRDEPAASSTFFCRRDHPAARHDDGRPRSSPQQLRLLPAACGLAIPPPLRRLPSLTAVVAPPPTSHPRPRQRAARVRRIRTTAPLAFGSLRTPPADSHPPPCCGKHRTRSPAATLRSHPPPACSGGAREGGAPMTLGVHAARMRGCEQCGAGSGAQPAARSKAQQQRST